MQWIGSIFEALYNLLSYAGEAVAALIESFTALPVFMYDFVISLGEPMIGFGTVITMALGALVLRIIIHII